MPKTPAEWRLLLKRLALVGFALGSVALATAGVVEGLPAAKDWLGFCIAAAVICYAVGGVLYPLGSYFPRDHPTVKHTCRLFKLEDMDLALAFFAEQLGHGLVTEARIQALHKVNERLFYIIESRPSNAATRPQITGCFSILPLKKGGVIHMEAGDYEAALQPTLIAPRRRGGRWDCTSAQSSGQTSTPKDSPYANSGRSLRRRVRSRTPPKCSRDRSHMMGCDCYKSTASSV